MLVDLLVRCAESWMHLRSKFEDVLSKSLLGLSPKNSPPVNMLPASVGPSHVLGVDVSPEAQGPMPSLSQHPADLNLVSINFSGKELGDHVKEVSQDALSNGNVGALDVNGVANVQSLVLGRREMHESRLTPGALAIYSEPHTFALPLVPVSRPSYNYNSEATEVLLRQAKAYMKVEDWDKALVACQDALSVAPDIAEAHKLIGNILQEMGRGIDSLGHYARALLANPSFPEVYANLGTFYARQQAWEDAECYYRKAINLCPDSPLYYRPLSKILKAANKPEEAREMFAQAVSLAPDSSSPLEHYQVGNFFLEQAQEDKAIECYRKAVESDSACVEAYLPLAELLEKQGDWQTATMYYRKAFEAGAVADSQSASSLTLQSGNPASLDSNVSNLAAVTPEKVVPARSRLGAEQPALSSRVKVIRQKADVTVASTTVVPGVQVRTATSTKVDSRRNGSVSKTTQTSNSLGKLPNPDSDLPGAIEFYRKSLELNPQQPDLHRELARVLTKSSQLEAAAQSWFQAFRLAPDEATAEQHFNLGNNLVKQGQLEQAKVCYQQAIRLNPEYAEAYEALGHVLQQQNASVAAAEAYRKALAVKGAVPVKK